MTAGGTFLVLNSAQPSAQAVATKSVVIALQNIPGRSEISAEAIGKADWPEAVVPLGAFESSGDVIGKLALENIFPGQIILSPMIIDKTKVKETRSNASFLIPEGKVAVAFPVTPLSGVSGALQAGDTVDLLLTLAPPKETVAAAKTSTNPFDGLPVTQKFLQDILILQVGNWPTGTAADKQAPAASVITVVVDHQDAITLKAAREQGVIELALRKAGDHKVVQTEPVTLQYLDKRFNFKLTTSGR
ncbi:MAG: Flp pilus assembly protein CpaB [Chloroflexi bacterium]|nr:Flp pilus assembly protein CpaB [Chloroflexota bacterium]MBI3742352.1 Flp pilus assembly protein CpaB [Chloroflexota bacterium]